MPKYELQVNHGSQPENAALVGKHLDSAEPLAIAIAHTDHGNIPGKALGDTCWYSYDGQEHTSRAFSWVVTKKDTSLTLVMNTGSRPSKALGEGFLLDQNKGNETMYCGVAISEWGTIPGKVKDYTCWFPYKGEEHTTSSFYWIVED